MGTLQHIQHQISAVNDLVLINDGRAAGYEKAIGGTISPALQTLFKKNQGLSLLSGKFYRTRLDLKAGSGLPI